MFAEIMVAKPREIRAFMISGKELRNESTKAEKLGLLVEEDLRSKKSFR
jgi:hypothetical protein